MSGVHTQKLRIAELGSESDLVRVECQVRMEPLVARTRSAAAALRLSKTLGKTVFQAASSAPRRSLALVLGGAIAAATVSLSINRADRKSTQKQHKNKG